ncbi:MAG: NAD(+)/NADH kinase [Chloroflexi bacterium]|nr:NAD(+)/NADH kinase [Chloroflexota bacterium]
MKRIGILYHPKVEKTERFARDLMNFLRSKDIQCWVHSSWDEGAAKDMLGGSDLIVSVGGDGTILRVARIIFPLGIPIVGINFGNLGFMTELEAGEAKDKLELIIKGEGWIDERAMLEARVISSGHVFHALNDVVVGRGKFLRLINIDVSLDGDFFSTYRADAVIISTATGSTGYVLAANGPVIYPESRDIILKAVCPHLTMDKAIVVPPSTKIRLKVFTNHDAIVSMDGQVEETLKDGTDIEVSITEVTTKFLRLRNKNSFYSTLTAKLNRKSL